MLILRQRGTFPPHRHGRGIHLCDQPSCKIFIEKTQRVSLAFIFLNGIKIELLEPWGDNSPIAKSLREGMKLVHLCYEVPDLQATLELCSSATFRRISTSVPAPFFDNRRIVWVFSRQYGLFELVERNRKPLASDSEAVGGDGTALQPTDARCP